MPCGACKYQRRRCGGEGICLLAPYFPPDKIQRFACVHRVFGASNVATFLKLMQPEYRASAALTLSYQAEARVRDPVNGCVGLIMELEETHRKLTEDLSKAHKELTQYMNPKDIQALCPRYGDYIKGKKVDAPMGHVLFDLDAPLLPNMSDMDLENWDPFPIFQNVDRPAPSFQMQLPQFGDQRGEKRKSIIN